MLVGTPHSGCVNTIESVLGSTDGISEIHVDLDTQKASIKGTLSIQELVEALEDLGTSLVVVSRDARRSSSLYPSFSPWHDSLGALLPPQFILTYYNMLWLQHNKASRPLILIRRRILFRPNPSPILNLQALTVSLPQPTHWRQSLTLCNMTLTSIETLVREATTSPFNNSAIAHHRPCFLNRLPQLLPPYPLLHPLLNLNPSMNANLVPIRWVLTAIRPYNVLSLVCEA